MYGHTDSPAGTKTNVRTHGQITGAVRDGDRGITTTSSPFLKRQADHQFDHGGGREGLGVGADAEQRVLIHGPGRLHVGHPVPQCLAHSAPHHPQRQSGYVLTGQHLKHTKRVDRYLSYSPRTPPATSPATVRVCSDRTPKTHPAGRSVPQLLPHTHPASMSVPQLLYPTHTQRHSGYVLTGQHLKRIQRVDRYLSYSPTHTQRVCQYPSYSPTHT